MRASCRVLPVASNGSANKPKTNTMKIIENTLTTAAICLPLAFVAIVLLSLPR